MPGEDRSGAAVASHVALDREEACTIAGRELTTYSVPGTLETAARTCIPYTTLPCE